MLVYQKIRKIEKKIKIQNKNNKKILNLVIKKNVITSW